jgi:ribulose-phosphate 3-epimerase
MGREYIISPSILTADFSKIKRIIDVFHKCGIKWLHLDIMDGHFVPNLTFGFPILRSLRKITNMFFDTHLMISNPYEYIDRYIEVGADLITVHYEAVPRKMLQKIISKVKSYGKKVGISIKPKTPASALYPYLKEIDLALIMTVEPGFGGQKFIFSVLPKIKLVRERISRSGLSCDIEVDGGVNFETIRLVYDAGANVFVVGNALFSGRSVANNIKKIKRMLNM